MHQLVAAAVGVVLAGALFVVGPELAWLPIAGLVLLIAVGWRRRPEPSEAAYARRWLLPPGLALYGGVVVYALTRSPAVAGAAGCAGAAVAFLAIYLRERRAA